MTRDNLEQGAAEIMGPTRLSPSASVDFAALVITHGRMWWLPAVGPVPGIFDLSRMALSKAAVGEQRATPGLLA